MKKTSTNSRPKTRTPRYRKRQRRRRARRRERQRKAHYCSQVKVIGFSKLTLAAISAKDAVERFNQTCERVGLTAAMAE